MRPIKGPTGTQPTAWPTGRVTGLRARGGIEVGLEWQAGRLLAATLVSRQGGPVRLRAAVALHSVDVPVTRAADGLHHFQLPAGVLCRFTP